MKDARLSSTYPPHDGWDCCTADKAIDSKSDSFAVTATSAVGEWWDASFVEGEKQVTHVRVLNRPTTGNEGSNSGQRLAGAKVTIGSNVCGYLPDTTAAGEQYDIACEKTLIGSTVRVTAMKDEFL